MEQVNRPRQLYRDLFGKKKEAEISEIIQAAEDLKNILDGAGWKRIDAFMKAQEVGTDALLDAEMGSISLLTFPRLFTTYLKYIYIVMERRAYKKIRNFVRVTIQNGEKYAERRAKAEAAKAKQQQQ